MENSPAFKFVPARNKRGLSQAFDKVSCTRSSASASSRHKQRAKALRFGMHWVRAALMLGAESRGVGLAIDLKWRGRLLADLWLSCNAGLTIRSPLDDEHSPICADSSTSAHLRKLPRCSVPQSDG